MFGTFVPLPLSQTAISIKIKNATFHFNEFGFKSRIHRNVHINAKYKKKIYIIETFGISVQKNFVSKSGHTNDIICKPFGF